MIKRELIRPEVDQHSGSFKIHLPLVELHVGRFGGVQHATGKDAEKQRAPSWGHRLQRTIPIKRFVLVRERWPVEYRCDLMNRRMILPQKQIGDMFRREAGKVAQGSRLVRRRPTRKRWLDHAAALLTEIPADAMNIRQLERLRTLPRFGLDPGKFQSWWSGRVMINVCRAVVSHDGSEMVQLLTSLFQLSFEILDLPVG